MSDLPTDTLLPDSTHKTQQQDGYRELQQPDSTRNTLQLDGYRDPQLVARLVRRIEQLTEQIKASQTTKLPTVQPATTHPASLRLMEVCGTHTMAIARYGLRSLLPPEIRLLSGPGCPVCVTANSDIDRIIALTRIDRLTVAIFGDMLRVPGSSTSLAERRAAGASVEVVYSPLDALLFAKEHPEQQVVFIAVGFETTAPIIAQTLLRAAEQRLVNFSLLSALKQVPPALAALLQDPRLALDGLILPGHVSTILGLQAYQFIATDYQIPAVVTGFEPVDILAGITALLEQVSAKQEGQVVAIGNAYHRAVRESGNPEAQSSIQQVFASQDSVWRGLGMIPQSGLALRPEYRNFDAEQRFHLDVEPTVEPRGCRCGDVLRGIITPPECPHFGTSCTPNQPLGACMVSSEGSCAAYYKYGIQFA